MTFLGVERLSCGCSSYGNGTRLSISVKEDVLTNMPLLSEWVNAVFVLCVP